MDGLLGILLAAGWGRRMGGPKALVRDPAGRTFLERVLLAVQGARPDLVVVVAGPWADAGTDLAAIPGAEAALFAFNPDPDRGAISSIRCALASAGVDWAGALVSLVDHPLVRPETCAAVADAWRETPDRIVVPVLPAVDGRRRGHPVVFPEWAFAELAGPLADAEGARAVVRGNPSRVREIDVDDPGIRMDLDTPEGYLSAFGRRPAGP